MIVGETPHDISLVTYAVLAYDQLQVPDCKVFPPEIVKENNIK